MNAPSSNIFPYQSLSPKLYAVVDEVRQLTQAPVELVLSSVLATASTVYQQRFDVERPGGLRSPVGLFLLTIADSGERKTSVDSVVRAPIDAFQSRELAKFKEAEVQYATQYDVWRFDKRTLENLISKNERSKDELTEHILMKPVLPAARKLIVDDVSSLALKQLFASSNSSVGIYSDEAGSLFKGVSVLGDPGFLNSTWNGKAFSVERKDFSLNAENPRLTIALMAQPKVIDDFCTGKGSGLRGIGFLARFYVCNPVSTQGYRFTSDQPVDTAALEDFHARIAMELDADPVVERQVLRLSEQAAVHWKGYFNWIESQLVFNGWLYQERDYASKEGEKVARLAALLHLIEGHDGEISEQTMVAAIDVSRWYLNEFQIIFGEVPPQIKFIQDMNELYQFIDTRLTYKNEFAMQRSDLQKYCQSKFRGDKQRLNDLLNGIYANGWMVRTRVPTLKGRIVEGIGRPQLSAMIPCSPNHWMASAMISSDVRFGTSQPTHASDEYFRSHTPIGYYG